MTRFAVDPIWGRSLITARGQKRFFLGLERLLPEGHRACTLPAAHDCSLPALRHGAGHIPDA